MKGFVANIEQVAESNNNFRRVIYTGKYSQLVLMRLLPGEEIGLETHGSNDQFFRVQAGNGKVIIDNNEYEITNGSAVLVPAGAEHNVINTSDDQELKLYTIYSPPHHKDGIVRATRAEAESNQEDFDGNTTE